MKKIYLMALSVGFLFSANAQKGNTTVNKSNKERSGAYASSTEATPQFGTKVVYLSEDFEGVTFPPTGWSKESRGNSTVTTADEEWHRTTNGNPGGAAFVTYVSSVRYHDEYLISPEVTLPNSACRITFDFNSSIYWHAQTLGGTFDNVDLKLLISTDDGTTWDDILWQEDSIALLDASYSNDWETFTWKRAFVDISAVYQGQDVVFAFHYDGIDGAESGIDNIVVEDVPNNELELVKAWQGDIVNDWEYSMLPLTQTREMIAGVVISNRGATAETAVVTCTIHDANGVVATPANISQLIPIGATDTVWFNTGYTPSANGVYHAEFSIPADYNSANNTVESSTLTINDNLMAHDYGTTTRFGWATPGANSAFADNAHSWGQIYTPTVTQDVYGMDVWIGTGTTVDTYILAQVYQIDPNNDGSWIQDPLSNVLAQVEVPVGASNINALTKVVFPSAVQLVAGRSYIFELRKADGTTGTQFYIAGSSGNNEDDDNSAVGKGKYAAAPNDNLDTYFTGWDGGFYIRANFENTAGLVETAMEGISIYPNPTEGKLTVTNTNNYNNTIEVVNLAGQVVYTGSSNTTVELNLNGKEAGVYFVTISNELGSLTEKVILK